MPQQLARLIGARAVLAPYSAFDNDVLGSLFGRRAGGNNLRDDHHQETASWICGGPAVLCSN